MVSFGGDEALAGFGDIHGGSLAGESHGDAGGGSLGTHDFNMWEWWQPVIDTCQRVRVGTKEDGQVRNQINKGTKERREMLLTAQRDSRI